MRLVFRNHEQVESHPTIYRELMKGKFVVKTSDEFQT